MMKKELRKMKAAENCQEPFKKVNKTFYVRNDDNRSRNDNWRNDLRSRRYVGLDSYPKFFRTTSKNNYVIDSSNLEAKDQI